MEPYAVSVVGSVAEPAGLSLDLHDQPVRAFGRCVRGAGLQKGEHGWPQVSIGAAKVYFGHVDVRAPGVEVEQAGPDGVPVDGLGAAEQGT